MVAYRNNWLGHNDRKQSTDVLKNIDELYRWYIGKQNADAHKPHRVLFCKCWNSI